MTGVQTCALPICFPVTIERAAGVKGESSTIELLVIPEVDPGEGTAEVGRNRDGTVDLGSRDQTSVFVKLHASVASGPDIIAATVIVKVPDKRKHGAALCRGPKTRLRVPRQCRPSQASEIKGEAVRR